MNKILIANIIFYLFFAINTIYCQKKSINYGAFSIEFTHLESIKKTSLIRDTTWFYYTDSMIMYVFSTKENIFKNDIIIDTKISYNYFIVRDNKQVGLFFKDLTESTKYGWFKKDSVLTNHNIRDNKFQEYLEYDSLVSQEKTSDSLLIEKYIPKKIFKGKFIDSIYFIYSKNIRGIPFSLSPYLDSMKYSKLSVVKLIYNSKYHPELKTSIPKQVWTYKLFNNEQDQYFDDKIKLMSIAKELFRQN